MAPKVYFTDFATRNYETLPKKLARLILTAGMDQIDFAGKYVAIKIHFGELGNLAFLRPNFAKYVADYVHSKGLKFGMYSLRIKKYIKVLKSRA